MKYSFGLYSFCISSVICFSSLGFAQDASPISPESLSVSCEDHREDAGHFRGEKCFGLLTSLLGTREAYVFDIHGLNLTYNQKVDGDHFDVAPRVVQEIADEQRQLLPMLHQVFGFLPSPLSFEFTNPLEWYRKKGRNTVLVDFDYSFRGVKGGETQCVHIFQLRGVDFSMTIYRKWLSGKKKQTFEQSAHLCRENLQKHVSKDIYYAFGIKELELPRTAQRQD